MQLDSIFWHDYETDGRSPVTARPVQFAGLRTDHELNPIGEPVVRYCRPCEDQLPDPSSVLLTGLFPSYLRANGLPEDKFIHAILGELTQPGTTIAGYNSIAFDGEVTRFTLFRNLLPTYNHEWQYGNTRWDLHDVLRMYYALCPSALNWVEGVDGKPCFALAELAASNGILSRGAHDALHDVEMTLSLARRVKQAEPFLWQELFAARSKSRLESLLRPGSVVVHASRIYGATSRYARPLMVVGPHPYQRNAMVTVDLMANWAEADLRAWLALDPACLSFKELPFQVLGLNKAPAVVDVGWLSAAPGGWLPMSAEICRRRTGEVKGLRSLLAAVAEHAMLPMTPAWDTNPDNQLYAEGFPSLSDQQIMRYLVTHQGGDPKGLLNDSGLARLRERAFRYRCRNYPESLSDAERLVWERLCAATFLGEVGAVNITLAQYEASLTELSQAGKLHPGSAAWRELVTELERAQSMCQRVVC